MEGRKGGGRRPVTTVSAQGYPLHTPPHLPSPPPRPLHCRVDLNTHVAFDSAAFPQLLLQNGVRGCEGSGRTGGSARVWSIPATVRAPLPDVLLTKLHPTRQLDICFFPTVVTRSPSFETPHYSNEKNGNSDFGRTKPVAGDVGRRVHRELSAQLADSRHPCPVRRQCQSKSEKLKRAQIYQVHTLAHFLRGQPT